MASQRPLTSTGITGVLSLMMDDRGRPELQVDDGCDPETVAFVNAFVRVWWDTNARIGKPPTDERSKVLRTFRTADYASYSRRFVWFTLAFLSVDGGPLRARWERIPRGWQSSKTYVTARLGLVPRGGAQQRRES